MGEHLADPSPDLPEATRHAIALGRVAWAINLDWTRRVESASRPAGRAQAVQRGMNLMVLNGQEQYGFASTDSGLRRGQPSLALALLDATGGENVLAAFPVSGDQFYVLAIEDSVILPVTDQTYHEAEARALISDQNERFPWTHEYIPAGWNYPNADQATLAELVAGRKPTRHRLASTSRRAAYFQAGAVTFVLALLYAGYQFYSQYQTEQLIEEGRREAQQAETAKARLAKLNTPIMPPMPSIGMPRGMLAVRDCRKRMDALPQYVPGWEETKVECDGSSVTLTLRQNGIGTINWLSPFLRPFGQPDLDSPADGLATARWRLDPARLKSWGDVHGQVPAAVSRYVNSQLQEAYQPFTLTDPQSPTVRTTTVGGNPVEVQAPWTTSDLTIEADGYQKADLDPILDRLQNFVLVSLSEDLPERKWTMRAQIYHYVPPPPPSQDPAQP